MTDQVDGLDNAQDLRGQPLVPIVDALGHVEEHQGVEECAVGGLEVVGGHVLVDLRRIVRPDVPVVQLIVHGLAVLAPPSDRRHTDQGCTSADREEVKMLEPLMQSASVHRSWLFHEGSRGRPSPDKSQGAPVPMVGAMRLE